MPISMTFITSKEIMHDVRCSYIILYTYTYMCIQIRDQNHKEHQLYYMSNRTAVVSVLLCHPVA